MEISNNTFSAAIRKYENDVKVEEAEQAEEISPETSQAIKEFAEQQCAQTQSNSAGDMFVKSDGNISTITNINIVFVEGAENVGDETVDGATTVPLKSAPSVVTSPTSSYSEAELDYIKQLIYNSHHSFIANFRDVDTFFDYVNTKKDSSITKDTGISRAQLVSLTQNDKWEDSHNDFFGSLNRAFYSLDKDKSGVLSYDEVKTFLNTYLKKDGYNNFKSQVQEYSNVIQKQFDEASTNPKAKIQLIIDYTRDYLEAAGLTNQIISLDRLLKEEDLFSDENHHIGNISFTDLNKDNKGGDYITVGGYSSWADSFEYTNNNSNKKPTGTSNTFSQKVSYFCKETDFVNGDKKIDLGLSFDITLLKAGTSWEYLVSTLVHELTHATMAEFSTVWDSDYGVITITEENLSALQRMGVFSSEEYETVKAHLKDINAQYGKYVKFDKVWYGGKDLTVEPDEENEGYVKILNGTEQVSSLSDEDVAFLDNLLYKIDAARGEYMAYQADADYLDSVGSDVLSPNVSQTAVSGDKEQDTIIDWINKNGYNDKANQPLPDWKWWSYA